MILIIRSAAVPDELPVARRRAKLHIAHDLLWGGPCLMMIGPRDSVHPDRAAAWRQAGRRHSAARRIFGFFIERGRQVS